MDIHGMVLALLCMVTSFSVKAISTQMDEINTLLYQDPLLAKVQLHALEQHSQQFSISQEQALRLQLLKCETYLQLKKNKQAIELVANIQKNFIKFTPELSPYFLSCSANAEAHNGNLKTAFILLDEAISQAQMYQQPQALSQLLLLRGQLDSKNENYLSAIEDFRLALDVYDNIHNQNNHWLWTPKAYIYAAMGSLLQQTGDLEQALFYMNKALKQPETIKKIRHIILLNMAKITLDNNQINNSNKLIKEAKALLPSQSSPLEMAHSYSIIAAIEIDKKNYAKAKPLIATSLAIFKKHNKPLAQMQILRLQAMVLFADKQDKAALTVINQGIELGKSLKQFNYLQMFYDMVSQYYAKKSQHALAYDYLKLSFDAAHKANSQINLIRFSQFQTRLSRQISKDILKPMTQNRSTSLQPSNWLIIAMIISMVILGFLLWYLARSNKQQAMQYQPPQPHHDLQPYFQAIETTMRNAKKNGHPFNLLIIDPGKLNQDDIQKIETQIKRKLREQDTIFHYSDTSMLILLPYTSPSGAKKVMRQLEMSLQPWLSQTKIKMGFASMKYFDTAKSLIKRAIANQICHYKANELKLAPISATR